MPVKSKKPAVPEISPTMADALGLMLRQPCKSLYRWQGGYWYVIPQEKGHTTTFVPNLCHGTSTIKALLSRGLVDVSESRTGRNGTFPTQVRLNHLSYEVLKCNKH